MEAARHVQSWSTYSHVAPLLPLFFRLRKEAAVQYKNVASRVCEGDEDDEDDDDGGGKPPAKMPAASKRPASHQQRQEKAKKQALATNNADDAKPPITSTTGIVSQTLTLDPDTFREKLFLMVTMPGNIHRMSQLNVEYVKGSNGERLVVMVPRGIMSSNMEKVKEAMCNMPGTSPKAAYFMSHNMENNCMKKLRDYKYESIVDPFYIDLKKAGDTNKRPSAILCQSKEDGDTVCAILLDVPCWQDYTRKDVGQDEAFIV
jgi:hypothetical protein